MSRKKVCVRVKPTETFATDYISLGEDGQSIKFKSLKKHPRSFLKHQISSYSFQFASILQDADQHSMFGLTAKPAIDDALSGTSGCVLCNGGPGSGKTYTLNGNVGNDYGNRGLIPRAIAYVFQRIAAAPELEITVRCSFVEFLNESLFDVLHAFNGQKQQDMKITEAKNGTVSVKNLFAPTITDEQGGLERLFMGTAFRAMNPMHLQATDVFTLWFDSKVAQPVTNKPLHSKIHFVDIASPVKVDTATLNRASEEFQRQASINRTLTVLERVLIADEHVPYRSCPLTHLLKDSLPNRCIIAHAIFEEAALPSTLGTLKFAARVQGETSDDILNLKEHKDSQIQRLQKEIDDSRAQLRVKNPAMSFCEPDRQERQALGETVTSYLSDALPQFPIRSLYEVRSAIALMKEQYRAQKVAAEEQLREKYVFTVKPSETKQDVDAAKAEVHDGPAEEAVAFFPLVPTDKELWIIYRETVSEELDKSITGKKMEVDESRKKRRSIALVVNDLKAKIDELKGTLEAKQKSRPPPINGVMVIDEEELHVRQSLTDVKKQYKEAYADFVEVKNNEETLLEEIEQEEEKMSRDFDAWIEERERQRAAEIEEEEEDEELLDREERRDRREYQRTVEKEPQAGPYFFAYKKVQTILTREYRANGTRRQPVTE